MHRICKGVYQVVGGDLTGGGDAMGYLVEGEQLALIDAGSSPRSASAILDRISETGHDPRDLAWLLITHGHVDHIGAVKPIAASTGCKVVCHAGDADAVRSGDPARTAASWYGVRLPEVAIDTVLEGKAGCIAGLNWLHTPGHTPGSVVFTYASADGLVLFGQDIHGPFSPAFGSDKTQWSRSMHELIALGADILCEGHYGIYRGKNEVQSFIRGHLKAQGFE